MTLPVPLTLLLDADGALSAFGTRNPIYYFVDGAGLAIRQELGDRFELSLGYLANGQQ